MPPTATRAASGCQVARISSLNDVPAAPALSSPLGPSFTHPLAPTPPRTPLAAAAVCIIRSLFALPPFIRPLHLNFPTIAIVITRIEAPDDKWSLLLRLTEGGGVRSPNPTSAAA